MLNFTLDYDAFLRARRDIAFFENENRFWDSAKRVVDQPLQRLGAFYHPRVCVSGWRTGRRQSLADHVVERKVNVSTHERRHVNRELRRPARLVNRISILFSVPSNQRSEQSP